MLKAHNSETAAHARNSQPTKCETVRSCTFSRPQANGTTANKNAHRGMTAGEGRPGTNKIETMKTRAGTRDDHFFQFRRTQAAKYSSFRCSCHCRSDI